jgi:ACS family hexuronate transporter-like MFS transporter
MPRETVSSVIGLGGFVCYFTGGVVSNVTGHILQKTGSYIPVFAYISGTYIVSLICIQLLVPRIGGLKQPPANPPTAAGSPEPVGNQQKASS